MDQGLELAKLARRQGQRFESAPWVHKARQLPETEFQREVEKELTGKDTEPSELIYFKVYKSQIPVIERAIETAALMLGSDKSRGYCLEMICADFLAGASIDGNDPEILLHSISRYYQFLPSPQQEAFLSEVIRSLVKKFRPKRPPLRLDGTATANSIGRCWSAMAGVVRFCGRMQHLQVHHLKFRSQSGGDLEENLITLCSECHEQAHRMSGLCEAGLH